MSKSTEEGAANTPPQETAIGNDKDANKTMYENRGSAKKIVRVLTVVAYVFSVSFAAIMLSAYYVFLWKPPNPRTIQRSPLLGESQAERLTAGWSGTRVDVLNVSQKYGPIQERNDEFGVGNELKLSFTSESNGKTDGDSSVKWRNDAALTTYNYSGSWSTTMTEPLTGVEKPWQMIDERPRDSDNSEASRNAVIIVPGSNRDTGMDSGLLSMIYAANNKRTTSRSHAVNADVNSPTESKITAEESAPGSVEYPVDASAQQFPSKSTSVEDNEDMTYNGSSDDRIIGTTPVSSVREYATRGEQDIDSSTIQTGMSNDQTAMPNTSPPTIPNYEDTSMTTSGR